ncbi:transposase IS66 [Burkholderia lata]|nr:transposase IS66 [Burkholderia lata]
MAAMVAAAMTRKANERSSRPRFSPASPSPVSRKKCGHRQPLDPNLPREVVRHEAPGAERVCAHDGPALAEIGVAFSEQLDVIPEQLRVIQHQRVTYACPCCHLGIKFTPAPARIIPRRLLS